MSIPIDCLADVLLEEMENMAILDASAQLAHEDIMINAGVMALDVRTEDKRPAGQMSHDISDGHLCPTVPPQVIAGSGQAQAAGQENGHSLKHQCIQCRPQLDGVMVPLNSLDSPEPISTGAQIGLQEALDRLPPPADILHVVIPRVVLSSAA
jgi:hypothetical protein